MSPCSSLTRIPNSFLKELQRVRRARPTVENPHRMEESCKIPVISIEHARLNVFFSEEALLKIAR
jgi:hypothetical protein